MAMYSLLEGGDLDDVYVTDTWIIDRYAGANVNLFTWGSGTSGQLGDGTSVTKSSPVQIGLISTWKQISCGYASTIAVKSNGTMWSWGANAQGQLGLSTLTPVSSPVQIGALTTWKHACMGTHGSASMYAIKTDGTLWACGYNGSGELGDGTTVRKSSPIQIGALTNWSVVYNTFGSTGALKVDGTLWTWGYNASGQLGDGTVTRRSSPVQVGALTSWVQLSVGYLNMAGVQSDGTLWVWGDNTSGQLGDGTVVNESSPIQIGINDWKQVACGYGFTAAIKIDGTLWTWGRNDSGQLGLGDTTPRSSPTQVGSLTNWKQVDANKRAASSYRMSAVKTDGTLWAWGSGTNGGLGDGTAVANSSPIQVGSKTNWKQVSVGAAHTGSVTFTGE